MGFIEFAFSWGSPVGLGIFFFLGSIAFYVVTLGAKNLQQKKK